jgi:DNA mismatch endonuclease (patch repair protein)
MSRQARVDTKPELALRRLLHARGLRYRVAWPVPGMKRRSIDVAFTRARVAVNVHGCFWHGCPEHGTSPKANAEWWRAKIDRNKMRDQETREHLELDGWSVLEIWEHEDPAAALQRVMEELVGRGSTAR